MNKTIIYVAPIDNSDGSVSIKLFSTEKAAEEFMDNQIEQYGQGFCDGPCKIEIQHRDELYVKGLDEK